MKIPKLKVSTSTSTIQKHACNLRKTQTPTESKLWFLLRNQKFCGYKFRRQHVLGPYIVDFICLKRKLIIELDGSQHYDNKIYDTERTTYLNEQGYEVLRFWNNELLTEFDNVLDAIYKALVGDRLVPLIRPSGTFSPQVGRRDPGT